MYASMTEKVQLVEVSSGEYYGKGYQDVQMRVPSVKNAEKHLGWRPTTDLATALRKTLDYHLARPAGELAE
jgi:nucleoside-diphosphate-sugar epimerase